MDTIKNKTRNAFTFAEMLIAMVIMAILLTALAVVFDASATNYSENEKLFQITNKARQSLIRITSELRTAQAVNPLTTEERCSLETSGSNWITYRYDSNDNTLYVDSDSSSYVLCDNVSNATFQKETYVEGVTTYVKSVQISITVFSGVAEQTFVTVFLESLFG